MKLLDVAPIDPVEEIIETGLGLITVGIIAAAVLTVAAVSGVLIYFAVKKNKRR